MRQRLGTQVEVLVDPVDCIPRIAVGKFRAVASLLPARGRNGADRAEAAR